MKSYTSFFMHRLFLTPFLWLALALSALGDSVEFSVTPNNLDQYKYLFSVSTNATQDGVVFQVTVAAKTVDIPSDMTASLRMVRHSTVDGVDGSSIQPVEPAIPITLKKDRRIWQVDFTVSNESLKRPGLCFVFVEPAHRMVGGKSVAMPSVDFYEIKLQDFVKP
jgi:hypothetical protein